MEDETVNRIAILTLGFSLAAVLCWAAEPNADEVRAIAEIEKLGGTVNRDEKGPGKTVIEVFFPGPRLSDAGLANLNGMTKLNNLILARTKVTDAGLNNLNGLNNLEYLGLTNTQVTAGGVKRLQQALPNCKIER